MTMNPAVQRLASDSGELRAVRGHSVDNGRFAALAFVFPDAILRLSCNHDTDEMIVEIGDPNDITYPTVEHESLAGLVGLTVEYAWQMTNHRGYTDAFQLRFRAANREEQTRQFEVAASAIDVLSVTRLS